MSTDFNASITYYLNRTRSSTNRAVASVTRPRGQALQHDAVPREELKGNMPHDLIVFRDGNGRQRILVPKCQRIALTQTEHETMLHVKGPRVLHELSRSYFWPHMAEEITHACGVCKRSQVQRLNLSSIFRQAEEKDMPLPRQAYGIDFYGHEKG